MSTVVVKPNYTKIVVRDSRSRVIARPHNSKVNVNFGPVGPQGKQGMPGASGGATATRVAASSVNALRVLVSTLQGEVEHADPINPLHFGRVVGISTTSALTGGDVQVQRFDVLNATGLSFTAGDALFVGANGTLVTTAPASAAWWLIVGYAVSDTLIDIRIREPIQLTQ